MGRHTVKNAMTPFIWMVGVASPICFSAAWCFHSYEFFCGSLILAGIVPIFTACFAFLYFVIRDPDRLHSEDYRLRSRALEITESKGGKIAIAEVELVDIANPYPDPNPKRLTDDSEEPEPERHS